MSNSAEKLYLSRKLGSEMGLRYVLSSFTPLLLILLVTAIIVFSLVFISSMSIAINDMIILLGSGNILVDEGVDPSSLPASCTIDQVKRDVAIAYSREDESIVYIKGVNESYFNKRRTSELKIEYSELEGSWIILSSSLSEHLGVTDGDRITLMVYEKDRERTRPVLLEVKGVFNSGYAQLDKYLAYANIDLFAEAESEWEILLDDSSKEADVINSLESMGYSCISYKEKYSSLYENVRQSMGILYLILVAIALLSAYFSIDVSHVYITRDYGDIASLRILGMSEKKIFKIYRKMTLILVFIAVLLGILFGLLLGLFSPNLIRIVSKTNPGMMEYYITSFSITIPWLKIFIMLILMLLSAYISLAISLSREGREDLYLLVNKR